MEQTNGMLFIYGHTYLEDRTRTLKRTERKSKRKLPKIRLSRFGQQQLHAVDTSADILQPSRSIK